MGLPQLSYIAFVSQARNHATGALGHVHWFTYTEDPSGVPGKYGDGTLAHITRAQTFTKQRRGETEVRETFSAVASSGQVHLALAYQHGGQLIWATAEEPNPAPLRRHRSVHRPLVPRRPGDERGPQRSAERE